MWLTTEDQDLLDGASGAAAARVMRIIVDMGRILGADKLIPITSAHIDGCLYHGDAGVAFAERLLAEKGCVTVPSTLNVGAVDLTHPEKVYLTEKTASRPFA